jgi:small-conductance mechanosensitive channel
MIRDVSSLIGATQAATRSDSAGRVVLDWLKAHGFRIAAILAFGLLVSWLGRVAVRRVRARIEGTPSQTEAVAMRRTATVTTALIYLIRVVLLTVVTLMILAELGVSLAPLVASAGIAAVALGFGAQSLVKDYLAGFYILMENQFAVGDVVELVIAGGGPVSGRVEELTLRATAIRKRDGAVVIASNGVILTVQNKSRGLGRLVVEVTVPDTDLAAVQRATEAAIAELRTDREFQRMVTSGPDAVGVEPALGDQLVVRVAAETGPAKRGDVEDELRRRLTARLLPLHRDGPSEGDGRSGA